MTKTPCIRPEGRPVPISAWASPLGISFGHQVANDAKTGSGTTEKRGNQGFLGELAGEPGFEPRLTESESVVLPLNYSPPEVSLARSVSGLIDKSFGIAKTQFAKKSSKLKALLVGPVTSRLAALRPRVRPRRAGQKNRLAQGACAGMLCPTKRMMKPAACVGLGALRGSVDNFSDRPQSRRTAEKRGGVDRQAQGRVTPSARQGQEGGAGDKRSRCFCFGRIGGSAGP